MNADKIFLIVNDERMSLSALLAMKREDVKTLYARGCAALTSLPEMPNVEYLYASGCAALTSLPEMPNVEYLYASGCAALTSLPEMPGVNVVNDPCPFGYFYAGCDSRGYNFEGVTIRGQWRVLAGCHNLSIKDSYEHWGPGGVSDRKDCLALVQKIAAHIEGDQRLMLGA